MVIGQDEEDARAIIVKKEECVSITSFLPSTPKPQDTLRCIFAKADKML